jgi:large subunit ribosomal protein L10
LSAGNADFFVALTKEQKQKILEDLKDKIAKQKAMVLVSIAGLKVKDVADLRRKLKAADGSLKVAKKTLIEKAFKENKLDFDKKDYKEELALVFGFKDEILPAKAVYEFSEMSPELKILGGFFENKFLESEKVIELAQLPTKEQLLARLVGSISAPISGFVSVLNGNLRNLVYILSQIKVT